MANAFNLTAVLNFAGPANLQSVINKANKQLQNGLNASVNIRFNAATNKQLVALQKNLQAVNATLVSITANANKAAAALAAVATAAGNAASNQNKQANASNKAAAGLNAVGNSAKQATGFMYQLGQAGGLALKRFAGFTIATGVVFGFVSALSNAVKEAIQFQSVIVKIAQVRGTVTAAIGGLAEEVTRLAKSLGVGSASLIDVSLTLSQAGLSANETKVALEALAKTQLSATFGKIENTVEGAIASMRQFSLQTKDLESALSSINAVSAGFAVESDDIITAVRSAGGAFAAASGDLTKFTSAMKLEKLQEFVALFTSVRSTTRESAESIATGLRTVFTRIQRGSTILALKELNIDLQDTEGNFVGVFEAVKRLSEGLKTVDPRSAKFNLIVEELGGFRQVNKVIPLIQRFGDAQKALAVAQKGQNSLTEDAAKAQESWLVQITKVREEFLALIRDISNTSSFQTIISLILKTTSGLIKLADAVKPILPLLLAFGAIKGLGAITQFGKGFFGGVKQGAGNGNTGAAIGAAAGAAATGGGVHTSANTVALKALTTAVQALTGALKVFGTARFPGIKFATGGMVPGVGNRDTVSASLMPGEFVLRKKVVERVGEENLQKLNSGGPVRLASGSRKKNFPGQKSRFFGRAFDPDKDETGQVKTRSGKGFSFGAVFLNPRNVSSEINAPVTASQIAKVHGKGITPRDIGLADNATIPTNFFNRGVGKSKQVDSIVAGDVRRSIFKVASTIKDYFGVSEVNTASAQNLNVKPFNFASIVGGVFEGAMALMGAPYGDGDSQRTFDFPNGIGPLAKGSFASFPSGIPTDAKRTATGEAFNSLRNKAANYISRFYPVLSNEKLKNDLVRKSEEDVANNPVKEKAVSERQQKINAAKAAKLAKRNAKLFASGGSNQGEIDALLTPGEFVFNPQAVRRIGVDKLDALNRGKQKFHKGGPVGFAKGGGVASIARSRSGLASPTNQLVFDKIITDLQSLGFSIRQQAAASRKITAALNAGASAHEASNAAIDEANRAQRTWIGQLNKDTRGRLKSVGTNLAKGGLGLAFVLPSLLESLNTPGEKQNANVAAGGGALQGAVVGGLAGAAFGAPGAVFGAVLGAATSSFSAFNDAVKQNAMLDLNKATKDLEETFKKFELTGDASKIDGAIEALLQRAKLSADANAEARAPLVDFGAGANAAQSLFGQFLQNFGTEAGARLGAGIEASARQERDRVDNVAKAVRTADLLPAAITAGDIKVQQLAKAGVADDEAKKQISAIFNSPELQGISLQAKEQAKQLAINNFLQLRAADAVTSMKVAFDNLTQRLNAAVTELSVMRDSLSVTNSQIQNMSNNLDSFGSAIPKITAANPFGTSNKTADQLSSDFNNFVRTTGISGQLEKDLRISLVGGKGLEEAINNVLLDAISTINGGGEADAASITKALGTQRGFTSLPAQVRNDAARAIETLLLQRQGQSGVDGGKATFAADRLENIVKSGDVTDALKLGQESQKVAKEFFTILGDFNTQYEAVLGQMVTSAQKVNASLDEIATVSASNANTVKQARGGRLSIDELARPEESRIGAEAARAGLGGLGAADIQARFLALTKQQDSLNERRAAIASANALGGDTTATGQALLTEQVKVTNQLNALANVVALSVKATSRLAAIQDKLLGIEQRKDAARSLGERLATAGPEEIFQINQELAAASALLNGQVLAGKQLADGLNILKGIGSTLSEDLQEKLNQSINNATGNGLQSVLAKPQDIKRIQSGGGLSLDDLIRSAKGGTAPEQALIENMEKILREQTEIQKVQANYQATQLKDITDASVKSLKDITDAFLKAMAAAETARAGKATGGFIPGRFGGADKKTYRVTPGEFIVNRHSAAQNAEVLQAMNKGGVAKPVSARRQKELNRRKRMRDFIIAQEGIKKRFGTGAAPSHATHPRNMEIDAARLFGNSFINGRNTSDVINDIRSKPVDLNNLPLGNEDIDKVRARNRSGASDVAGAKRRNAAKYANDPLRLQLQAKVAAKRAARAKAANTGGGIFNVAPERPNPVAIQKFGGGSPIDSIFKNIADNVSGRTAAEQKKQAELDAYRMIVHPARLEPKFVSKPFQSKGTGNISVDSPRYSPARVSANEINRQGSFIDEAYAQSLAVANADTNRGSRPAQQGVRQNGSALPTISGTSTTIPRQTSKELMPFDFTGPNTKISARQQSVDESSLAFSAVSRYRRKGFLPSGTKYQMSPMSMEIQATQRARLAQTDARIEMGEQLVREAEARTKNSIASRNASDAAYAEALANSPSRADAPIYRKKRGRLSFGAGGAVPGQGNRDSIPAVLTPGEFVVTKKAAQQNLAILQSMNRGGRARGFANGTAELPVGAPSVGGSIPREIGLNAASQAALKGFGDATTAFAQAVPSLDRFTQAISNLNNISEQLANITIPDTITVSIAPVQVNVNINGAEALASIEAPIRDMITKQINTAMSRNINPITGETNERFVT